MSVRLQLMKNVLTPLAKSVSVPLRLTANKKNLIEKKKKKRLTATALATDTAV